METLPEALLIKCLDNSIKRYLDDLTKPLNMTSAKCKVIHYLEKKSRENEKVYVKDIEVIFNIKKSSASEIVSSLEKDGCIKKSSDSIDSRHKELILTEKGYRLSDETRNVLLDANRQMLNGFDENDVLTLRELLEKMIKNIEEVENGRSDSKKEI